MYWGDSAANLRLLQGIVQGQAPELAPPPHRAADKLLESFSGPPRLESLAEVESHFSPPSEPLAPETPFFPLERVIRPDEKDEVRQALLEVFESGRFTSGEFVGRFEKDLEDFTGVPHAVATCSGTEALLIGFLALGVGPGDEVILPANSFAATENAVLLLGAVPVYVDIDPDTYNMDPALIAGAVTAKTKVILPVHLYGKLADMEAIQQTAERFGLPILEDACQAIGATGVGRWATMTALSFNPHKNMGVCGKAGALLIHDPALARRARMFSYHGFEPGKKNIKALPMGLNAQMDNTQAAVGLARFPYLALNNLLRLFLAHRYAGGLQALEDEGLIKISPLTPDHVWHLYTIEVLGQDRDQVRERLQSEHGVQTDIYYTVLSHQYVTDYHQKHYGQLSLPVTEQAHERMIQLPIYPNITLAEQDRVIAGVNQVLRG